MTSDLERQAVLGVRRRVQRRIPTILGFAAVGLGGVVVGQWALGKSPSTPAPVTAGSAWSVETVAATGSEWEGVCSVAVDSKNQPHLTFYDAVERRVRYAVHGDVGWMPFPLGSDRAAGTYSSIDIYDVRPNWSPSVAYTGHRGELRFVFGGSDDWIFQTVDDDAYGPVSLALGRWGSPHLAYSDRAGQVKVARRDDRRSHLWQHEVIATVSQPRVDLTLAADSKYDLHLVYRDSGTGQIHYARSSADGWTTEVVGKSSGLAKVGFALNTNDVPCVTYRRSRRSVHEGWSLQYACRRADGWSSQTVDEDVMRARHSALAFDSDGNPHISYTKGHDKNYQLIYAHWDGQAWAKDVLVGDGDVGHGGAIAVDRKGTPHVCFYDRDTGEVSYARSPPQLVSVYAR
jgi:hypothetical protein